MSGLWYSASCGLGHSGTVFPFPAARAPTAAALTRFDAMVKNYRRTKDTEKEKAMKWKRGMLWQTFTSGSQQFNAFDIPN
jgi:hypothetical protein